MGQVEWLEGAKMEEALGLKGVARTIRHCFPDLVKWLGNLPDRRNPGKIKYSVSHLTYSAMMMFLTQAGSRQQHNANRDSELFGHNMRKLSEGKELTVAHGDTIAYYLEGLAPEHIQQVVINCMHRLMRMKALDRFRLFGYRLVAIDGTTQLAFDTPHCDQCLVRHRKSKVTSYSHQVLEAKLVTDNGLSLSMMSEFVEGKGPTDKQDCELNAFRRLAERLDDKYRHSDFCLLADALYANASFFEICQEKGWKFIVTFKQTAMPDFWKWVQVEARVMRARWIDRDLGSGLSQRIRFVEDALYQKKYRLNAVFFEERKNGELTYQCSWLTNFMLTEDRLFHLANKGGRLRWRIENEGFNSQKTGGFNMEHAYSLSNQANKNFYLLLQMAHMIFQLTVKGLLASTFKQAFRSLKNFAIRLLEQMRYCSLPDKLLPVGQIRFSSA